MISVDNTTIGFIGTGVMGRSMAGHLIKAGYRINVHNRTRNKAAPLIDAGAAWQPSPADVARSSDLVFTIVGFPVDVEDVYLASNGLVAAARPGTILVDMTTSSPQLAVRIFDAARAHDIAVLDAPVSGGDTGARNAALSIMVGGERDTFDEVLPVLKLMGTNIVYQGKAGSGQHTKMANQIAIASTMMAVCEALAYAKAAGLDPATVLKSISGGAAGSWTMTNLAPRMLAGDFEPGFYVKHFIKDMAIAAETARRMDISTPGLDLAKELYEKLATAGNADKGTQALYKLYAHPDGHDTP